MPQHYEITAMRAAAQEVIRFGAAHVWVPGETAIGYPYMGSPRVGLKDVIIIIVIIKLLSFFVFRIHLRTNTRAQRAHTHIYIF